MFAMVRRCHDEWEFTMRRDAMILLVTVTLSLGVSYPAHCQPNPSARTPFQGKIILFGAQRVPPVSGAVEIIRMNVDGTEIESLLKLKDVGYMTGRVSPDGRRLAFGTLGADGQTRP